MRSSSARILSTLTVLCVAALIEAGLATSLARADAWTLGAAPAGVHRYASATLLQDGRVLVVSADGAELYDPASGRWTATANQPSPARDFHAAVLLRDGQVLIAGGGQGQFRTAMAQVDRFDPRTNTWTALDPMPHARTSPTATLLKDGRVLVVGDGRPGLGLQNTADIYTPGTDSWTAASSMSVPRAFHTATLLPSGKVLVAGGWGIGTIWNTAEVYDPSSNSWQSTANTMSTRRTEHAAVFMPMGQVIVAGGKTDSDALDTVEAYNPATNQWGSVPANMAHLSQARSSFGVALLPNGNVLFVGGLTWASGESQRVDLLDMQTQTIAPTVSLTHPRTEAAMTLLPDGRVIAIGGIASGNPFPVDLYDNVAPAWTPRASAPVPRAMHAAYVLRDGRVLTFGGVTTGLVPTPTVQTYDITLDAWGNMDPLATARVAFGNTLLADGRVLVAGGMTDLSAATTLLATTEIFDPGVGSWSAGPPLSRPRVNHRLVRLRDGSVLAVGGQSTGTEPLVSELLDPQATTWSAIDPMTEPNRPGASATLLADGRVLVAGGGTTATAEIFDPFTRAWVAAGSMSQARAYHEALLLLDGRVLVAGGEDPPSGNPFSAEIYDPASDTWTDATIPGGGGPRRDFLALARLPSGLVAVVGGRGGPQNGWLFDPTTAAWAPFTVPPNARSEQTATLLPDGRVLFTGGMNGLTVEAETGILALDPPRDLTRRPFTTSVPASLTLGSSSTIEGTGLSSDYEASNSGTQDGATNYPLVRIAALDGAMVRWLRLPSWSNTRVSAIAAGLPVGPAVLTVVTNGIPSLPSIVDVNAASTAITTTPTDMVYSVLPRTLALTARVSATSTPVGHVVFTIADNGGGVLARVVSDPIDASGRADAAVTFTTPTPQTLTVDAHYTGDDTHAPSHASSALTIQKAFSTTILVVDPKPTSVQGRPVKTFVVIVPAFASGVITGTTTVQFGAQSCQITGATGECSFTVTALGSLTTQAVYLGSATHQGSSSVPVVHTVVEDPNPNPNPTPTAREYALAEGVTNGFFQTFVAIANPNATAAPITVTLARGNAMQSVVTTTLAPMSRYTLPVTPIAGTSGTETFATKVVSTDGLPLIVERSTYFDREFHAGHLSSAVEAASRTWYFAEGSNGFYHTYLLLGNVGDQPADVTTRFLREDGSVIEQTQTIAPHTRATIDTPAVPGLSDGAFGITVSSTTPIVADRVQYFGSPFVGAHADSGRSALSTDWYFADGAGGIFDTFLLLANGSAEPATATVDYFTEAGETVTKTYSVPANGRRSISAQFEDPALSHSAFWMHVRSDRPIIAERAMYLAHAGYGWTDAHATTGATVPALRWGFAEGIAGTALGFRPYVLIGNPTSHAAEIRVEYLRAEGGAPLTRTYTVEAFRRFTIDVAAEPSLDGISFGIVVSSTNNTPIVVERSLYWTAGTPFLIGAMGSMGVPLP